MPERVATGPLLSVRLEEEEETASPFFFFLNSFLVRSPSPLFPPFFFPAVLPLRRHHAPVGRSFHNIPVTGSMDWRFACARWSGP